MKGSIIGIIVLFGICGALSSCNEDHIKYDDAPYVMFADTVSIIPALQSAQEFPVHIASLRACDVDRTYAIEIAAQQSTAVQNWHYVLSSQTVTIPAGKTTASINVKPIYENIPVKDTMRLQLNLVSQFDDAWSPQGSTTKVLIKKICPLDINDFAGYCRVNSKFLMDYKSEYTRTIKCEVAEDEKNVLILRNFYYDNYDLRIQLDDSDPLKPVFKIIDEQVIADTRIAFGVVYGDGRLLAADAPGTVSTFDACNRTARLNLLVGVDNVGIVGAYPNLLVWIEEHEI